MYVNSELDQLIADLRQRRNQSEDSTDIAFYDGALSCLSGVAEDCNNLQEEVDAGDQKIDELEDEIESLEKDISDLEDTISELEDDLDE